MTLSISHTGLQPQSKFGITAVNGLLTFQDSSAWNVCAAKWGNANTKASWSCMYYFEELFGLRHGEHVRQLANLLRSEIALRAGGHQDAIGHSNGSRLIVEALLANPDIHLRSIHLLAAWLPCNCIQSGLNSLLKNKQVDYLYIYTSTYDDVLGWNHLDPMTSGFELGKEGPQLSVVPPTVMTFGSIPGKDATFIQMTDDTQTHSSWINPRKEYDDANGFNQQTIDNIMACISVEEAE